MIAGIAALFLSTVASLELMRKLKLMAAFRRIAGSGCRACRLLGRSGASEWAKERALRLMSVRLLLASLQAGLLLALVAMPILLMFALDMIWDFGAMQACIDPDERLWALAFTIVYCVVRRAVRPGQGERLFQRIALGTPALIDTSFDIERRLYGRAAARHPLGRPVFVAGLARAGTTMLTRAIHASDAFATLAYRDLPFPLAPNGWARIGAGRSVPLAERGHGDGIAHDLDSPEAIEEIFWRNREKGYHALPDGLAPVPPAKITIAEYRDYVALVALRCGRSRYLSKNNNNILRLPALVAAFPDAHLIHPFRDPLQQAASLLDQHVRACRLALDDPYRARFMGWLGHHEFGADHRPFLLPGGPSAGDDPWTIDHWLKIWVSVHRSLLHQPADVRQRQIFVDYDRLCGDPDAFAPVLASAIGLPYLDAGPMRPPAYRPIGIGSQRLMDAAYHVHDALVARSLTADAKQLSPARRHVRA